MKHKTMIIWIVLLLLVTGLAGYDIWQGRQDIRLVSVPPVQLSVGQTAGIVFSAANENIHVSSSNSQVAAMELKSVQQGQVVCQVTAVAAGSALLSCQAQDRHSPAFAISVIDPAAEQNQEIAVVASQNGGKYHLPTCAFAKRIGQDNLISFATQSEAAAQGYSPCKQCLGTP